MTDLPIYCYISSTFLDLKAERTQLYACLARQQDFLRPINSETPSPNPVLQDCFADIDRCQVYILLLGACYGTDRVSSEYGTDLSYTHHEYLHARKRGKACFIFQIEATTHYDVVEPEDVAKARDFRASIEKDLRKPHKVSSQELNERVLSSLLSWHFSEYRPNKVGLVPRPQPGEPGPALALSGHQRDDDLPTLQAALMILLIDRGVSEKTINKFDFDAELSLQSGHQRGSSDLPWELRYQELNLEVGARQSQFFHDLGHYINVCWQEAENKLYSFKRAAKIKDYTLHIEIFACTIGLNEDFSGLKLAPQPLQAASPSPAEPIRLPPLLTKPFVLRSLDRVCDDASLNNNLETQWRKLEQAEVEAIATCSCPYSREPSPAKKQARGAFRNDIRGVIDIPAPTTAAQASGSDEWDPQEAEQRYAAFLARLGLYPAHFHLPSLPIHPEDCKDYLSCVVSSGIPFALWWRELKGASQEGLLQRCEQLFASPNRREPSRAAQSASQQKTDGECTKEDDQETRIVHLQTNCLSFHDLAKRKRELFARGHSWVADLVLLVDSPKHQPKKTRFLQ
jgi:hypothetical protein